MSSPRPSRLLALVLSLVPGFGHVYLGRERAGLALFTLAAVGGFLVFNAFLVLESPHRLDVARASAAATAALWLGAIAHVVYLTSPRRQRRVEEEKVNLLKSGMIFFLRDEMEAAETAFRTCLKLDRGDVEALVRLGVLYARRGQAGPARRTLRRARSVDVEGKWSWEVERELQDLRGKLTPAAEAPPGERTSKQRSEGGRTSPGNTALATGQGSAATPAAAPATEVIEEVRQ
jgi:hypothetical protein